MTDWIAQLLQDPDLTRMGHGQRIEDANLGLGWLYYGLARVIRPQQVVVIGSYRGFVPLVLGKALADNVERGEVCFIDPSLVDDFWRDPLAVAEHFSRFGITNIRHFLMTTQEFVRTESYRELGPVGIVFIDGLHTEEQARFDFEAFRERLAPDGIVLFHDTRRVKMSSMYGPDRRYELRVKCFVDSIKIDPRWQVLDLPYFDGVSLVRRTEPTGGGQP
jgi:predicted O-methyltransferase YrrM